MSGPLGSSQWMYASGYEIDQSLRFNDNDSAYLNFTPVSAGNRRTWTYSAWVKVGNLGTQRSFLSATGTQYTDLRVNSDDDLEFYIDDTLGTATRFITNQKLRDSSAWYHIVVAMDTTQSTEGNRVKIYVNGVQVTSFSLAVYPAENYQGTINNNVLHAIGRREQGDGHPYDGYLAELNFIDGQQLTPADFGETGTYGEWKPVKYSGTYGTNGFYLPFKQDYTVEGFSTVTYKGNGGTQYIGGTGFQPDMLWVKERTSTSSHQIHDAIRGAGTALFTNATSAESSSSTYVSSFNTDGFNVGSSGSVNSSTDTYVAWNWDMGGSNATNSNGSITSTVRANPTYGQSIVSYTGNATGGATIGHGLSSAPEIIINKNRSAVDDWSVYTATVGTGKKLFLNSNAAEGNTSNYPTTPTNSLFYVGAGVEVNGSGNDMIAYCFHSVTGYSKIGSYTGNGSNTGTIVTTGFRPAFLLIKNTEASGSWYLYDSVREPADSKGQPLYPNNSNGNTSYYERLKFTDTGFQLLHTDTDLNGNNTTYFYMAFADTREYAYWLDQSGNNNDWTSNNLTESDISVDSPTNNFATFNPINTASSQVTLSEGNLAAVKNGTNWSQTFTTMSKNTGKIYIECLQPSSSFFGIATETTVNNPTNTGDNDYVGKFANDFGLRINDYGAGSGNNEGYSTGGSFSSFGTAQPVANNVTQLAVDFDNNKIWWGKNNTWFNSGNPATNSNGISISATENYFVGISTQSTTALKINFGQDSSFSGNKTAQGNQDGNGIGDFYYAPPTGFLALCTSNLPAVAVTPSEYFNTVLYTGNGSDNRSIGLVGFQPDWVWIKERSSTSSHILSDAVRGATKQLKTNSTGAESSNADEIQAFESDGFQLGTEGSVNENTQTYVAWNWKANGSGSSNTNGSITSTVSANVDAGFSIVSYTGNGTAGATVGHGLSKKPEMLVVKKRDGTSAWMTANEYSGWTGRMNLDTTNAAADDGGAYFYGNTATPTNSVFYLGSHTYTNGSSNSFIAYCFHSVDGYSKMGIYTGSGGTDGTFVYTGFRPAFVLIKRSNSAGQQAPIYDSARDTYNETIHSLKSDDSAAELTNQGSLDLLSNGFKARNNEGSTNTDGGIYIYIAFAETPFKYSNAR